MVTRLSSAGTSVAVPGKATVKRKKRTDARYRVLVSFQTCGRFGIPWSFQLYKLMFVIVIPTVFTVANYGRLFLFTRISSLRVQQTGKKNALSGRDTRLLKHMVFVIAVYVGSWAPIYTVAATVQDVGSPDIVYGSLGVLPNVGLLIGTIDLFLYNNRFRKMLTRIHPSPAQ